ncbi:hypothetical protein E2C01_059873 [Portunus trituberculatus]|uniref:Uncharacterized protein n=1 Tax=Portunus trituberculatus TaxID=210409 RepID=A0A5B7H8Z4_PORTR|nr:hypothetical protein [Portunus trituberculatus]
MACYVAPLVSLFSILPSHSPFPSPTNLYLTYLISSPFLPCSTFSLKNITYITVPLPKKFLPSSTAGDHIPLLTLTLLCRTTPFRLTLPTPLS